MSSCELNCNANEQTTASLSFSIANAQNTKRTCLKNIEPRIENEDTSTLRIISHRDENHPEKYTATRRERTWYTEKEIDNKNEAIFLFLSIEWYNVQLHMHWLKKNTHLQGYRLLVVKRVRETHVRIWHENLFADYCLDLALLQKKCKYNAKTRVPTQLFNRM